jgi:hypothetical protein
MGGKVRAIFLLFNVLAIQMGLPISHTITELRATKHTPGFVM